MREELSNGTAGRPRCPLPNGSPCKPKRPWWKMPASICSPWGVPRQRLLLLRQQSDSRSSGPPGAFLPPCSGGLRSGPGAPFAAHQRPRGCAGCVANRSRMAAETYADRWTSIATCTTASAQSRPGAQPMRSGQAGIERAPFRHVLEVPQDPQIAEFDSTGASLLSLHPPSPRWRRWPLGRCADDVAHALLRAASALLPTPATRGEETSRRVSTLHAGVRAPHWLVHTWKVRP